MNTLISKQTNVGDNERMISAASGGLLAYYGLRYHSVPGLALAAAGGYLLFRAATGYCPINETTDRDTADKNHLSLEITRSLTINKPREELYAYWRQLENLPTFMKHLQEVRQTGEKQSHWVAKVPGGMGTVAWDAEITQEEENQRLAWRSLPGLDIENTGEVQFKDAPANRGTIVQATITYQPPAAAIGNNAAKLLNPLFKQMVKEDLRRFKRVMETGGIPTIAGQPSGTS